MGRHFLNLSQDQLYVLAKLMTMSAAEKTNEARTVRARKR